MNEWWEVFKIYGFASTVRGIHKRFITISTATEGLFNYYYYVNNNNNDDDDRDADDDGDGGDDNDDDDEKYDED